MADEAMLTSKQAAERLQVQVITVQRWLASGRLQGTKLPGRAGWRIPQSEVQRVLSGGAIADGTEHNSIRTEEE
jgi:excisionase family DNA binding protein